MRTDLTSGTVTLVFADIEGSTKLLHELGLELYADALAEHRRLLRLTEEGYIGEVVHLGARIGAPGHGGQVLLSEETR